MMKRTIRLYHIMSIYMGSEHVQHQETNITHDDMKNCNQWKWIMDGLGIFLQNTENFILEQMAAMVTNSQ